MRKTKPICPARPEMGAGGRSRKTPPASNYEKRTQFPAVPGGTGPEGRGTRGKCAKRTQFPDCGLRIADLAQTCGGPTNRAKQTQFRQRERRGKCFAGKDLWLIVQSIGLGKTKPIWRSRAGIRKQMVQNEPNSSIADWAQTCGGTPFAGRRTKSRLYKQTQLGGANCAKRSQFFDCGLRISDCGLGTDLWREARPAAYRLGPRRAKCAKRTQFPFSRALGNTQLCETKPNLGELGYLGDGTWQDGPNAQKRTQFARRHRAALPRPSPLRPRPRQADCAKRSQFAIFRPTRWTGRPPLYAGRTPMRRHLCCRWIGLERRA